MIIRAVGAIALRSSPSGQIEVLLIRKQGGMWTLPKGRVKRDEPDEVALARELREETGLRGQIGEPLSQTIYRVRKGGRQREKTVVYYLVSDLQGEIRPGTREGITAVRWMPVPRALKRIGRPRIRAVVRAALTMLGP